MIYYSLCGRSLQLYLISKKYGYSYAFYFISKNFLFFLDLKYTLEAKLGIYSKKGDGKFMQYVKLGNTGLDVSKLCLGCMSFGVPGRGIAPWSLNEEDSRVIIKKAINLGINFFDTANVYSDGTSEEILGRAIKDFANRDEVVIASKVYFPMFEGQNSKGLSRKSILREVDKTLERLQMEYLDLYIIHRLDKETPIEEIMEALHDVVKSGKARYIGASSMSAWEFSKCQYIAEKNGWTKFVSMQDLYNLIYREEEREMVPLCQDLKVGITPWSPLAKGRLTRDVETITNRSSNDAAGARFFPLELEADRIVIERVKEIAEKRNVSRAQIALAWVLSKDYITSPIIGSTKVNHLEDSVKALDIILTEEEITYLEEAYVPHDIIGY